MSVTDMTKGNPAKLMLRFAFPIIITNLGKQFYMITDAAIVGRGVGVEALAAIGCTDWTYWVVLWSVSAMTQGFATFVARYFGQQNYKMMNRSLAMSIILSLAIALLFTGLGIALAKPILNLLETPKAILSDAVIYLTTMLAGTVIITGYNLVSAILRALGDGKSPLMAMIFAAVLNILLDILFVMLFEMGVFGAAFASLISQVIAFLFCAIKLFKIECINLDRDTWKPDPKLLFRIGSFGLPLAVQYTVINIGGMFVQSKINLQGPGFVAGYTATCKLYGILESTAISLGASFTTFVSQNFGAGNYQRVKKSVFLCLVIAVCASLVIMLMVLPVRNILPQFFIDKTETGAKEAIEVGGYYLTNMLLFLPVLYLIYVYRSHFQSIGDSFWSMVSGFGESATRIIMAKLFVGMFGTEILFFVEPFSWIAALLFVMVPYYFCRDKRFRKEIC